MRKLLLLCLLTILPVAASAYDAEINGIYYNLNRDAMTAEVTSGDNQYEGEVVIPGSINYSGISFNVNAIGRYAFAGCNNMTSVTIPPSVKSFEYCSFDGCKGLKAVCIYDIASWCSISSVYHAQPLEYAHHLFLNGEEVKDLVVPNGVVSIGKFAFAYCTEITSVTIPNSIKSINNNAFAGCTKLSSVYISDLVSWCNIIFNTPKLSNYHLFLNGDEIQELVIPNNMTSIGDFSFGGCIGLTSVKIPSSVTTIGNNSFEGCNGLQSITIPNSVMNIGNYAFYGCSSLTSIEIPNSVMNIGSSAFLGCSGLTSIEIPNSVMNIGSSAFQGCSGLTSSIKIPNTVTKIENFLFAGCSGLTSIDIPSSIKSIGRHAFLYCSGLTSITIPNSVTSIGESAFSGCYGLTSITIPNSVTSIERSTFKDCGRLTSATIPNTVTRIGETAFQNCRKLTSLSCLAAEVPQTAANAFNDIPLSDVTLFVPLGSQDKYAMVEPWKNFGKSVEIIDDSKLFPDCPAGEIRDAAIYLYHKGIVKGEDGKLLADREATRAEAAKTSFYGAYFGPDNVPAQLAVDNYPSVYADLQDKGTYYYRPAKALLYLEYGDGVAPFDRNRLNFEPEGNIARVNVLKELMETFNIKPDLDGTGNPFPKDNDVVALAKSNPVKMGYIRKAAALGIITTANEQFNPYANCTRGHLFLMLARIMQKIEAGEIADPKPQEGDYFQPPNTTLATISLGAGMQMGNFQHYTKTSFALNGLVPLAFAHTYNSYNTTLPTAFFGAKTVNNVEETYQPLGDGWSHNYHSFITVVGKYSGGTPDNGLRVIVHWGGGSIDVYKSNGSKLVPESYGVYDQLYEDDGDYVVKTKSQVEYRFSRQGGTGAAVLYLHSIKDRNGNTLTINYEGGQNGNKRISSVSDGQRSLHFSYISGTDLLQEVKDPLNRTISFTYFDNKLTGRKQLETFTDAEGNTTTYEYGNLINPNLTTPGSSKLLSRIKLPKGNYIENEYDANRRLSQTVSGVNGVPTTKTSVTVEANYGAGSINTQSQVDVVRGSQTSSYHYTYNENNVVTSMTEDGGLFVNSTYGNANHPELPTAIQNNSTDVSGIVYDERGNVLSITVTGDGTLTTTMTYDGMNNLTSVTDPNNNTTTYSYNAKGNLVGVSAPENVTASITVDEDKGLPKEVKNPMGVITKYTYNKYGNVETVSLPALGLSSSAVYDAASRVTSTKDALGRMHSFEYNNNDFLKSETDALNHTTSYAYDANDNLTAITNAKDGVTTMSYDNATDWLTSVEFAGAKKQYEYNKDGTLSTFTKPDGTSLSYSYDKLGRVTNDGVNSYGYDEKLRLQTISGSGKTLTFSYDGFNRIKGTSCDGTNNSYRYDKNGNCTSINNTTYEYDGLNRLTKVTFSGKSIKYSYRKDSKLDKVEYPNGMKTSYGYDEVGRLTSKQTTLSNGTVVAGYSYKLDKVGNILVQTMQEPYDDFGLITENVECSYDDGNRVTMAGNISFSYKNGNTTKRGSESYQWDKSDRLTQAGSTSLTYDPLGLIASYGDITFKTDPMGMGNVIYDSKSRAEYIYGNGLEARVIGGKVSYYVTDVRGSVVAIVDENGNITHKYQYDEFGKVTQKEEADYNPFQYVGKYGVMYLSDNLYYMRARHYDPTIGRFLSEDPIWSTNLYPYAENNPIMGIDPKGESFMKYAGYFAVGGFLGSVGGLVLGTGVGLGNPVAMAGGAIVGGVGGAGAGVYLAYKSDHKKKESYDEIMNNGAAIYGGIIKIGDTVTPKTK